MECYAPYRLEYVKYIAFQERATTHTMLYWLDMGPTGKTDNEVSGLLRASETVSGRLIRSCMRPEEAMRGLRDVCPGEVR
jgi:hypothetical protein